MLFPRVITFLKLFKVCRNETNLQLYRYQHYEDGLQDECVYIFNYICKVYKESDDPKGII